MFLELEISSEIIQSSHFSLSAQQMTEPLVTLWPSLLYFIPTRAFTFTTSSSESQPAQRFFYEMMQCAYCVQYVQPTQSADFL